MTFQFIYNVPMDNQTLVSNPYLSFTVECYYLWHEPNGKPFINVQIPALTLADTILIKDWLLAYNQISELAEKQYNTLIENNLNAITCSI